MLYWKTATEKDLKILQNFVNDGTVIELEPAIKLKTAVIRKTHRIKLPDAIIAATALVYDLILLSRNIADFKNIDGLKILDPWNL